MKLLKRTLAMLLVLCMVLGMVPFAAFAEETTEGTEGNPSVPTHMATKPADGTVTGQPFNDDASVSRNYRIPGLVNHNGTLIATADVRYNAEKDGGGIDIVVSRSADNGKNWNYTFPAYLGDNGNVYNGASSTIMDPLIISDGETLYLLYDLFSAGYSLGTWNTTYGFWATGTGFDSQGRLRLGTTYNGAEDSWNYYLEDGQIKDSSGNAVAGYTVDAWFNVYQNDTYVSNLFFKDSPYMVYPTSYIAMQTSTDGGSNWSDPQLLNIKENGPTWEVLGPGTGLVTAKGELAFTTYDNTNIYLIHGKDNDWSIVKTPSATNESSIVELADGTIRAFVKNNSKTISYVDFTPNGDSYTAGAAKSTGIPNTGSCMVSSMIYSKGIDGEDVILVCCPKGSDDNTRRFGTLHAFKADSMELVGSYQIDTGYTDQFFAYSDMAELENGKLALIYEDGCGTYNSAPWNGASAGIGYSHISYTEIDLETALNVKFDVPKSVFNWGTDNEAVEVRVPVVDNVTHIHVEPATVANMTEIYSAYDIVLCKDVEADCADDFGCTDIHTGVATVSLTLTDALKAADDVKGFVVEADGSITSVFDVENDGTSVTFDAPHFSVVGIAAMTEEEIAQKNAVEVTLYVGENHTITLNDVALSGEHTSTAADVVWTDETVYTATRGTTSGFTGAQVPVKDCLYTFTYSEANKYIISARTAAGNMVYVNPYGGVGNPNSGSANTVVEVVEGISNEQIILCTSSGSLHFHNEQADPYWNRCTGKGGNEGCKVLMLYRPVKEGETSSTELPGYVKIAGSAALANEVGNGSGQYLIVGKNNNGNYYLLYPTTETGSNNRAQMVKVNGADAAKSETKITITGKTADTTEVEINGVIYKITVKERIVQDITLTAGETETFTIYGQAYSMDDVTTPPDGTIATLDSVVATVPAMVPVTAIESGKQYLIVNKETGDVLTDTVVSVSGQWDNKTGLDTTGKAAVDSTELWTITGTEDSCTIVQNGKHLTIAGFYANMSDTVTNLTLEYTESGWTIYDDETTGNVSDVGTGGYYLSDSVGNNYTAGALGTNDTANTARYWDLYEVYPEGITTVTFAGVAAGGPTTAVIGDVTYNITVEPSQWIDVDVHLHVDETKTITDKTGNYTVSEPPVADIATVTVAGQDITETTVSTEKATTLEPGATYIMRVYGSQYVLSANVTTHTAWGANNRAYEQNANLTPNAAHLWTLETADGGFKLKNGDSYLALGDTNNHSEMNATGEVFTLTYTDSGWTICNPYSRYINALGGNVASASVGGWTGDGTRFDLYKATTTVTGRTEITFTGVAEGETQAIIGNTRYNIYVTEHEQEIVDVDLYVGETKNYTIDGTAYTDANVTKADNADTVVQTQVVGDHVDGKELRVATEIISGRKYMLMNTRVDETLRNEPSGNNRLYLNGTLNAEDTTAIWTITAVEGTENGYTVQDANNKYLKIPAGGQAGLSDTSITLTIEPNGTDEGNVRWQIKHGGQYLNSHDGSNDAGGYNVNGDGGSQWVLYEVAESTTEVSFTGLTEGETQVTVGHVQYNITVTYRKIEVTANLGITTRVPVSGTVTQDAIDQFNAKHGETVTVALDGDELVFTGVTTGDVTAILGDTQYVVTSAPCVVDITLHAGISRTLTIDGFNYTEGEIQDTNSALLVSVKGIEHHNKELRAITSLDDLVSGKQYVLVNNRAANGTPKYSVLTNEDNAGGLNMTGPAAPTIKELWTIDEATGGYTIHQGAGYLTFQENAASVIDTEHPVLTLEYTSTNFGTGWLISLNGSYLSDHGGNSSNFSKGYNTRGDSGNYWTIYEIVELDPTYSTEVTFKGVTAGTTTTAQVGHVTYNITVEAPEIRPITLYVGVTQNDFIEGFGYNNTHSTQPDNTYAYIHSVTTENGDTKVVFSGVAKTPEGKVITATVGHVIYHITVEDLHSGEDVPGFNCVIGEGEYESGANVIENLNGKEVKSLRISEGMEFNLGVDITDADTITWENTDSTIATVDETGKITAVSEGTTLIKATVTKNGVSETMAVHVTVVPSMVEGYSADEICHVVYYIDTVHMTDPFYTMFLSSENTTGPVAEHTMVMVSEAEVIVLQRPKEAAFALVWTSDPWDGHALTYMAATGTRGEYFPLQSDNGVLETGTVNGIEYYKGSVAYNNIINAGNAAGASWQAAFDALLEYNVHVGEDIWQEFGCDGAMSMSRGSADSHPNTATSLSFISEKLPEVSKTINGILGNSGKKSEWKLYQEGMYTEVGEHVYYNITVTQDAPHSWQRNQDGSIMTDAEGRQLAALQYDTNAMLRDRLMDANDMPITLKNNPPYFYTKELDAEDGDQSGNGIANDDGYIADVSKQKNAVDIHKDLNAGWTQAQIDAGSRTLTYYVVYRIQQEDFGQLLKNGVGLDYTYGSAYSRGSQATAASATATMRILGESLKDLVVDFGQPVTFTISGNQLTTEISPENTRNAQGGLRYGGIEIKPVTQTLDEGTTELAYEITYTPNKIMNGYDVVYLMDADNNLVNYFRVYPATTVFYEEGFLVDLEENQKKIAEGKPVWNTENATMGTERQTYETLEQKVNPYGYDPIYADDLNGASGSYISANAIGANTSFTFTGTGFDLYANCDAESGYLAVTVRRKNADDTTTTVKLITVNTKVQEGDTPATAVPDGTEYHLPIVSLQNLDHATYTVEIRKVLKVDRTVTIDGVRIYNTIADSSVFVEDLEDNPVFYELRDYVLKALDVRYSERYDSVGKVASQVFGQLTEGEAPGTSSYAMVLDIDSNSEISVTTTRYNGNPNAADATSSEAIGGFTITATVTQGEHTQTDVYCFDNMAREVDEVPDGWTPVSEEPEVRTYEGNVAVKITAQSLMRQGSYEYEVEVPETTEATEAAEANNMVVGSAVEYTVQLTYKEGDQTESGTDATYVVYRENGAQISELPEDVEVTWNETSSVVDKKEVIVRSMAQDLLDNGPKNELFLYPGQTLAFKVNTSRMMQLGLKAPAGVATSYTMQYSYSTTDENGNAAVVTETVANNAAMNSSVDMFYELNDPASANIASQATITATGDKENDSEGSANLVDGATSTLYKFYNDAMTNEQSVTLTFDEARKMNAMAIAFENVGETDGTDFAFTYSILAGNGNGEYDTIVDHATANRTDDSSQSYTFPEETYSEVKIVMHSCTTNGGTTAGWPAIAEFEVYSGVEYTVTVTNTGNAILSVTKLKVCDDPNAKFAPLTVADVEQILLAAGYPADEEEETPSTDATEPAETKPAETKPVETQPVETQPKETTPVESQPENTVCAKDETCVLSEYSDIVITEWYHDGIHYCVDKELMNGMSDGIFAPNDFTTRAQLVTILYRQMGMPKTEGKTEPFTDVAEGDWYYDAVVWAYSENVVKGISETEFAPNANVTREQVATILHRFLAAPEGTGKLEDFSDAASVSDYAKDAMVWAVGEGLINGVELADGTAKLDPTGNATRAQIATILYRYLENA